jgi:hypothetical protein
LGITDSETQNICLLLETVDKLVAGHRNPWADWVRYRYAPGRRVVPVASWSMFQRLTIVNVGAGRPPRSGLTAGALPAPSPRCFLPSSPTASTLQCPWRARSALGSWRFPFGIASAPPPRLTSPPSAPSSPTFASATPPTPVNCGGSPRELSVPAQSTEC